MRPTIEEAERLAKQLWGDQAWADISHLGAMAFGSSIPNSESQRVRISDDRDTALAGLCGALRAMIEVDK